MSARWIQPQFKFLYGDLITGIGTTPQIIDLTDIGRGRMIDVYNAGDSNIYFSTLEDIPAGVRGVLTPGCSYSSTFEFFDHMYYKAGAAGGSMSIIIWGV